MVGLREFSRLILLMASLQMATGCATVFNSKITSMKIVSKPPGATVIVGDGLATCKTPCVVKLKTEESVPVTATIEGFAKYQGIVTRRIAASFWVNFSAIWFAPIGMSIDYLTKNMWTWRNLSIKLIPIGEEEETPPEAAPEEKIVDAVVAPPAPPRPPISSDLPTTVVPIKKSGTDQASTSIRSKFPKVLVERRVEWFFGSQNSEELGKHVECVYQIMENHPGGYDFPLDDAVKLANGQKKEPCQNNK